MSAGRGAWAWWLVPIVLAVGIAGVLLAWEVLWPGASRYYTFL